MTYYNIFYGYFHPQIFSSTFVQLLSTKPLGQILNPVLGSRNICKLKNRKCHWFMLKRLKQKYNKSPVGCIFFLRAMPICLQLVEAYNYVIVFACTMNMNISLFISGRPWGLKLPPHILKNSKISQFWAILEPSWPLGPLPLWWIVPHRQK